MTAGKKTRYGEFELIERIRQRAAGAPHLVTGIGDDCAVTQLEPGRELLTSTDLLIEGIHFERRWTSMADLGRKAVAVNISDIAAMGGTPRSLYLGVAYSEAHTDAELEALLGSFLSEAEIYATVLAGGDTCRSPGPLMISVTVQGDVAAGRAIRRTGARPGDSLYVTGTLGGSALALQLLQAGEPVPRELADLHHRPQVPVALGEELVQQQLATAMLDISDGLLGDLGHICRASGVGAEVQLAALPLCGAFRTAWSRGPELIDLALTGGEDYQLLFTSPNARLEQREGFSGQLTRIGRITSEAGIVVKNSNQEIYQCSRKAFDHFS